jgi:xanthine dehydrogenase accessory factor
MDSVDLQVLSSTVDWLKTGHGVVLATVVETWGSAPRPAGALLAIRDDGQVSGSVSGGCVEDDLIDRIRNHKLAGAKPEVVVYGVTKEQAARFGLPCGGRLQIVLEPLRDVGTLPVLLDRIANCELIARTLDLVLKDGKKTGVVVARLIANSPSSEILFSTLFAFGKRSRVK